MATFNQKFKEIHAALTLMQKYLSEGKFDSVNLQGVPSKIKSLRKLINETNEEEIKQFQIIESLYYDVHETVQEYRKRSRKANKEEIKVVKNLEKVVQSSVKDVDKRLNQFKSMNKTLEKTKATSDVLSTASGGSTLTLEGHAIKGTVEEQKTIKLLLLEYRKFLENRASDVKELNRLKNRLQELNKNGGDTRKKAALSQQYYQLGKQINGASLSKALFKVLGNRGHLENGKLYSDVLKSFVGYLADNLEREIPPDVILESFLYNKEISNYSRKPKVTSGLVDAKASVSNKSPRGWAAHFPTDGVAKFGRKIGAGAGKILGTLFGHVIKAPDAQKEFSDLVFSTFDNYRNKSGTSGDTFDNLSSSEILGMFIGAATNVLDSPQLSDEQKERFKVKKSLVVANEFYKKYKKFLNRKETGMEGMSEVGGALVLTDSLPDEDEVDKETISAIYALENILGVNRSTPAQAEHYRSLLAGAADDTIIDKREAKLSLSEGFKHQKITFVKSRSGSASDAAEVAVEADTSPESTPGTNNVNSLGGTEGLQQQLYENTMALRALSHAIQSYTHMQPVVGGGFIAEDIEQVPNGKSTSQAKQEARDRERQRQKSFIDLLIPALGKLLKKNPVWDAVKLLLFKLGATHPKTAAALLLGGAPLAIGATRFLGRTLLGMPNWAAGGTRMAKAGTFGTPAQNFQRWVGGVKSNTFSGDGIFANLKKASFERAEKAGQIELKLYRESLNLNDARSKYRRARYLERNLANRYPIANARSTGRLSRGDYYRWIVDEAKANGTWSSRFSQQYMAQADQLYKSQVTSYSPSYKAAQKYISTGRVGSAHANAVKDVIQNMRNLKAESNALYSFKSIAGDSLKAIGKGIKGNAAAAWSKYSLGGKLGTWKTLGKAAKGAPGIGALFEVLFDIPDIIKAATSGKKGALIQQLSQTLGGALGAIVGAFFGPLGWILGPLIGRSIGKGFGKRSEQLGSALGHLVDSIGLLAKALQPVMNVVIKGLETFGEALADLLAGLINAFSGLINFLASKGLLGEEAKKDYESKIAPKKYIEQLDDVNSPVYKKFYQQVSEELRQEYLKSHPNDNTEALRKKAGALYDEKYGNSFTNEGKGLVEIGKEREKFINDYLAAHPNELASNSAEAEAYVNAHIADRLNKKLQNEKKYAQSKMNSSTSGAYGSATATNLTPDKDGFVTLSQEDTWGTFKLGNDKPKLKASQYAKFKKLDDYMRSRGIRYQITGMTGSGHTKSSRGIGHGDGYKFDIQPLNSLGRASDQFDWETTQWMNKEGFMSNQWGSAGFHTMDTSGKGGYHYDLTTAGPNSATGTSSSTSTETKVFQQTNDDVRSALLDFAKATNAKNKKDTIDRIVWDTTDVTGSLGCWGIVQLNNTGQMVH